MSDIHFGKNVEEKCRTLGQELRLGAQEYSLSPRNDTFSHSRTGTSMEQNCREYTPTKAQTAGWDTTVNILQHRRATTAGHTTVNTVLTRPAGPRTGNILQQREQQQRASSTGHILQHLSHTAVWA